MGQYHALQLAWEERPLKEVAGACHAGDEGLVHGSAKGEEYLHELVAVEVVVQDVVAGADALRLALEWGSSDEHLQDHAPYAPLINLGGVICVSHYELRSTVPQSYELTVHGHISPSFSGKPKIAHFGRSVAEN